MFGTLFAQRSLRALLGVARNRIHPNNLWPTNHGSPGRPPDRKNELFFQSFDVEPSIFDRICFHRFIAVYGRGAAGGGHGGGGGSGHDAISSGLDSSFSFFLNTGFSYRLPS